MDKKDLISFFSDINKIKHKEREGWKNIGVEQPRDTIASHSYGSAMIGWIIAEKTDLDTEKVIKTLLVHDLLMAYIPDYTPEDKEFNSKKELEKKEMEKLEEKLPEEIRIEVMKLLQETLEQQTEFAKLVKEADKLETLLQALLYSKEKNENHVQEFIESYREYFNSPYGKQILKQIEEESKKIEE